ncbi:MAG: DnaJ domain-containing protein [Proteobacteria bacterium]|nr:DnaJ domain-containing protein [Pseudomonadota bacterium]
MGRTYYEILQVAPEASADVISAAYRARMKQCHPDVGGDPDEASRVNEAYEFLSDPERRAHYDGSITRARPAAPGHESRGAERRRVKRHEIDAAVSYCIDHDSVWHSARVVDFSILGMRLRSHEQLTVGQSVVIVPPNLAALAMHGTVRWVRVFHPTIFERVYEAGVEFPDQITNIRQRLST